MTKDEALRLALKTLKADRVWLEADAPTEIWEKNNEAIKAINEALETKEGLLDRKSYLLGLYDQKPWVGLTDDEREQVINANTATGLWHMAKAIEAKLKGKNA